MIATFIFAWRFHLLISINISITLAYHPGIPKCSNDEPNVGYQAFVKENFFFQCELSSKTSLYVFNDTSLYESKITWFFQQANGKLDEIKNLKDGQITKKGNSLWFSPVDINNSGNYICKTEFLCLKIKLDVNGKEKCLKYEQRRFYFITGTMNSISCPSIHCHQGLRRSNVKWYKNGKEFKEYSERFSLKIENDTILLYNTHIEDSGHYACDYGLQIDGRKWIIRASVDVEIGVRDTQQRPKILYPGNGTSIEAELGKPLELKCRVHFGFERNFKPLIKWERINPDSKQQELKQTHLRSPRKEVEGMIYILTSTLEDVTLNELNSTFFCRAQNSIGITTAMIKLVKKRKDVVFLVYILCFSFLSLLILVITSALMYIYWIEIVLLYRNYLSKDETVWDDDKEYDAFISYAKRSFSMGEETSEDSYEEERFAAHLLPCVLENKYNYKLCLLERDILPGGVYINEIVQIIKRSRRAIFILSPRYLAGPSLFELHAAVKCLMEEEQLKLILIQFKPFEEPESLPRVVKKALRTLPVVTWNKKPSSSLAQDIKFWNRVRYHMPVKKK